MVAVVVVVVVVVVVAVAARHLRRFVPRVDDARGVAAELEHDLLLAAARLHVPADLRRAGEREQLEALVLHAGMVEVAVVEVAVVEVVAVEVALVEERRRQCRRRWPHGVPGR